MQFRIGERDPETGLYALIWPDGSSTLNGLKIFNAAHAVGDVVSATRRSDGMMILDGVKATDGLALLTDISLRGFGAKPVGYLNGQVFNDEEEVVLPVVSIDFAPGSPEELKPGDGTFVFRIKVVGGASRNENRRQSKDLKVLCKIEGTIGDDDYEVDSGLDDDLIAIIPAGSEYVDIEISPLAQVTEGETLIIKIIQGSGYRIANPDKVTVGVLSTGFIFIMKNRAIQSDGAALIQLLTISPPLFHVSNTDLSEIEILPNMTFSPPTPLVSLATLGSLPNPHDLLALAGVFGSTTAHPLTASVLEPSAANYQNYIQFDLRIIRDYLALAGFRYLIITKAQWRGFYDLLADPKASNAVEISENYVPVDIVPDIGFAGNAGYGQAPEDPLAVLNPYQSINSPDSFSENV